MLKIATYLLVVLLTGCQARAPQPLQSREAAEGGWKLPYDEWYFYFFTPFALYADVTVVQIIDVDGYLNRFYTLDTTENDPNVKGAWPDRNRAPMMNFNKVKSLPQYMMFCWDSVIDKKNLRNQHRLLAGDLAADENTGRSSHQGGRYCAV
ncbi:Protein of uncharacterised function (DUF2931) [Yokenella regensburgei]|nr:Protein of uncharacterised function (DUF2931) [Yokenella regensburgei]